MSKVTCPISGLQFSTTYCNGLVLQHTDGFPHPIFAAPKKALHRLYAAHCRGKLTQTDSYLTLLAILHSTGKVTWNCPVSLVPTSPAAVQLVEKNIAQLVGVIEKSDAIVHPSFSQPKFSVHVDNSNLAQLPNYISAWNSNIDSFYASAISDRQYESLKKVENKLTHLINSNVPTESMAKVVADWAARAADFPTDKVVLWKDTIASCFSITKMFNTPLDLLKEIKDYCECNIEVGSLHFHTLSKVLKEGIARHVDYLGGSSLALSYTILPSLTDTEQSVEITNLSGNTNAPDTYTSKGEHKNQEAITSILSKAPTKQPVESEYNSKTDFLRAKLAYRVAVNRIKEEEKAKLLAASKANILDNL